MARAREALQEQTSSHCSKAYCTFCISLMTTWNAVRHPLRLGDAGDLFNRLLDIGKVED